MLRGIICSTLFALVVALPPQRGTVDQRDIAKLFERQDREYPPAGAVPDKSTIPQSWLDRLATIQIPNIPVSQGVGRPNYPGYETSSKEVCSFTYECVAEDDLQTPPNGVVSFTFDDGPSGGSQALWSYLDQTNSKGMVTHFMIGSYIRNNPDVFRRIASEGGHVASHTWSHQYTTNLDNEQVVAELGWSLQIMADSNGGRIAKYWRPPFGDVDNRVRAIAKGVFGLETVVWNQDTGDWNLDQGRDTTVQSITNTYRDWLSNRQQGLNVLHHEVRESQIDAFKAVYPALTDGWQVKNIADAWDLPWYQNALTGNSTVTPMSVAVAAPSLSASASSSAVISSASAPSSSSPASTASRSVASSSASSAPSASATAVLATGAGTIISVPWIISTLFAAFSAYIIL